nr:sensor domain-containing diguanylate cyclase [Kineococcus siccus]
MNDVTRARVREAALAEAHDALAAHATRVEALAQASRALSSAEEPRAAVCDAVLGLTGADAAVLLEPDADGRLRTSARAGLPLPAGASSVDVPAPCADVFASGQTVFVADTGSAARSGVWQPVVLAGGRCVGVLGVFFTTPLTSPPPHVLPVLQTLSGEAAHAIERAELLRQLAEAAEVDALTGLANRRRWDAAVAGEIQRAERTGAPLTLALVDLDHFKRYNDTHGHLAGDALLREFATAATSCLRGIDTLARWGGEEFVVALPNCVAADAREVADRIRAVVPHGQTCTVGIAQWAPGLQAADVIARADQALYGGKQSGRDVTVVHTAAVSGVGA